MTDSTITQSAAPTDKMEVLKRVFTENPTLFGTLKSTVPIGELAPFVVEVIKAGAALSVIPQAPADPQKWIDDPHDIEQGQMLNPEWLKLHNLTAQEVQASQAVPSDAERLSMLHAVLHWTPDRAATPAAQPVAQAEPLVRFAHIGNVPASMVDHPGILALENMAASVKIIGKEACWNHASMYEVRDALCDFAQTRAEPTRSAS